MRYAAPVAMPAGLGEWLGAELEARGVEAASLYARAVLSILLHSETEAELERDPLDSHHSVWNSRAALELELRLERQNKETRRGRASKKTFIKSNNQQKYSGSVQQRANNMAASNGKSNPTSCGMLRRRPHSWNGDEEELKKCAAIECLLSATDDDQWPVEKLVDELCTRLKLLQLEQGAAGAAIAKQRWAGLGSSAPDCFECPSSDSDSFTSVSSPEVDQDNYHHDFPPLECLSDSDQFNELTLFMQREEPAPESIWNVRQNIQSTDSKSRVRFVRMAGTRLSPPPLDYVAPPPPPPPPPPPLPPPVLNQLHHPLLHAQSFSEGEAYFGDCSRDSSMERALTPASSDALVAAMSKRRLYERGTGDEDSEAESLNTILNNAFKSFCQLHEESDASLFKRMDCLSDADDSVDLGVGDLELSAGKVDWDHWSQKSKKVSSRSSIWAPLDSDWMLLAPDPYWSLKPERLEEKLLDENRTSTAVQLSLALLNHHPERSSFSPVLPLKALPKNSKLMDWLAGIACSHSSAAATEAVEETEGADEKEIESILKDPDVEDEGVKEDEDGDEEENLLTSPKTHFCPIQQEGEPEVQVKDGATFEVDAQPEEVHFLRSPSGALYLPENQENGGDGWKGWTKYMVYKTPPSRSPTPLVLPDVVGCSSRPLSPFTLKFRVIQTEKCCQTDVRLPIENGGKVSATETPPLSISSPIRFSNVGLLDSGDVWKFDAEAVTKALSDTSKGDRGDGSDGKEEEVDGLLNEVWSMAVLHDPSDTNDTKDEYEEVEVVAEDVAVAEAETEEVVSGDLEFEFDELWNPFMEDMGHGGEQVDMCEWIPQSYEDGGNWVEEGAESWPPPNIPVEYLDDEFFDEIYGSLDSKASETAVVATSAGSKGRRHNRRRRRNSQNKPAAQRRRPCSFFVEGECLRPDCKFSHDLAAITCRFWIESSCFKGDACPFLHALPSKESDRNDVYPHSDAEMSAESFGSEEHIHDHHHHYQPRHPRHHLHHVKTSLKKFQFDLDADFPSLSQATDSKPRIAGQSRPITITHGFAAADHLASSQENAAPLASGDAATGIKRRRKRHPPSQRVSLNAVITSSESSPVDAVVPIAAMTGKRSRKTVKAPTTTTTLCSALPRKKDQLCKKLERRRTKSEAHDDDDDDDDADDVVLHTVSTRLRLSSSYKEG